MSSLSNLPSNASSLIDIWIVFDRFHADQVMDHLDLKNKTLDRNQLWQTDLSKTERLVMIGWTSSKLNKKASDITGCHKIIYFINTKSLELFNFIYMSEKLI